MDDESKKIRIVLNHNNLNVIYSTIEHLNRGSPQNFPNLDSIANEGLSKSQWTILKSTIVKINKYVGLSENGTPIEWDKESILKKISEEIG